MARQGKPIELRICVYLFNDANVVWVGQRWHRDRIVAIAQRLENKEPVFLERAGKRQVRRCALHSMSVTVDPSKARYRIFKEPLPFVRAAASAQVDNAAGEPSVL